MALICSAEISSGKAKLLAYFSPYFLSFSPPAFLFYFLFFLSIFRASQHFSVTLFLCSPPKAHHFPPIFYFLLFSTMKAAKDSQILKKQTLPLQFPSHLLEPTSDATTQLIKTYEQTKSELFIKHPEEKEKEKIKLLFSKPQCTIYSP